MSDPVVQAPPKVAEKRIVGGRNAGNRMNYLNHNGESQSFGSRDDNLLTSKERQSISHQASCERDQGSFFAAFASISF
jgi:hypothetical protein